MKNNTPDSLIDSSSVTQNSSFFTKLNCYNRWIIGIALLLISIILLVSFLIWKLQYPDLMKQFLQNFSLEFLNNNWHYNISFLDLSSYTIAVISSSFILAIGTFFWYKKRNFWFGLIVTLTIILIIILLVTVTLLLIIADNDLKKIWSYKTKTDLWLFVIPWTTVISLSVFILIDYLILMFCAIFKPKQSYYPQLKKQKSNNAPIFLEKNFQNNVKIDDSNQANDFKATKPVVNDIETVEYQTIKTKKPVYQWTNEQIEEVWNKGRILSGYDARLYRRDYAGAMMYKRAFVSNPTNDSEINQKSYNWTIVPQAPLPNEHKFAIDNLLPMNTINALSKGNDYPQWKTKIIYDGKENVYKEQKWRN